MRNAASELLAEGAAGLVGLVGDAVQVTPGYEAAIAAVLGPLAEGVLAQDRSAAFDLASTLRGRDLGVVDIVIADVRVGGSDLPEIPGTRPAHEVVTAPAGIQDMLARVLIADDLDAVRAVADTLDAQPAAPLTVVTRDGEVFTGPTVRAGSGQGRSRLELAAERDGAADRRAEILVVADSLREALGERSAQLDRARAETKASLSALREHDAALAAHAERVNRATVRQESASAECERLTAGLRQAQAAVEEAEAAARSAQEQLTHALELPRPILDVSARDSLLLALEEARDAEMRARLDVETLRERVRAGQARVQQLERQRERERAAAELTSSEQQSESAERLRTGGAVGCWFVLNIIIGNLNGWILKKHAFAYPVLLTSIHMVVCWICSGVCLQLDAFRPKSAVSSATLRKVAYLSFTFCLSVTCGNVALRFIYVSFAQMVTAAGPLFTIMLMYTMTGKQYSRAAYASMS